MRVSSFYDAVSSTLRYMIKSCFTEGTSCDLVAGRNVNLGISVKFFVITDFIKWTLAFMQQLVLFLTWKRSELIGQSIVCAQSSVLSCPVFYCSPPQ
eukprot:IDg11526t1